jgi:isoquinoline 1-oxidoreductase alpha subunit
MIMSALALLRDRPRPTDSEIDARVTNACRCGTYHRVRQAIHRAADLMNAAGRSQDLPLRKQDVR